MSKSAILSSSIAKKYWMALTGLFLCLFLVGHLLGNLQLIFSTGEEGKRAFNEYAYFMTHNPFIKVMSWVTYLSIIFHAVDGIMLTIQNKKARPVPYVYNNPSANSSLPSRYMAILGSLILIFIVMHMSNFWWRMKYASEPMPLHKVEVTNPQSQSTENYYITHTGDYVPVSAFTANEGEEAMMEIKDGTKFYLKEVGLQRGEGYKDLHSVVLSFFGHDKTKDGIPEKNDMALFAVIFYVISMIVLGFHLWHGFAAAFQSLGLNHKGYNKMIKMAGQTFAVVIPALFAVIPVILYMTK